MGRHSAPEDDSDDLPGAAVGGVLVEEDGNAGRHSVGTDDVHTTDDAASTQSGPLADGDAPAAGESSLFDLLTTGVAAADVPPTDVPPADVAAVDRSTAEEPAVAQPGGAAAPAKRRHGTRDDIALIRSHGDVRARVLAGILVPFVIYVAVQLAIGASGRQWLLFAAIPLIVAGVLVGAFLDAGHKRYPASE